jgi:hypothetical protein
MRDFAHDVALTWLEERTGADMMVSAWDGPCTAWGHVLEHLARGALLVQVKLGMDLAGSVGDHMNDQLARMSCAPRSAQRILLFTGILLSDKDGYAVIDGRNTPDRKTYAACRGGLSKWNRRGGRVEELPSDDYIPGWCKMVLAHQREEYTKQVYNVTEPWQAVDEDHPLQLLVKVDDFRNTLRSLPGVDKVLATRIWDGCDHDPRLCVNFVTDPSNAGRVTGFGPKKIATIRDYLKLNANELWTVVDRTDEALNAPMPEEAKE